MTLAVVTWSWGGLFGPEYVNRTRSMLARNLKLDHRMYCITDDASGIDGDVITLPMWQELSDTPRCRRRMRQYAREIDATLGKRLLSIDLDVVIVDDITPVVDRPEPIVCWRVGYAGVYSGSFVLWSAGALDGAWQAYRRDPEGYPRAAQPKGIGSDQAMLNHYLKGQKVAQWTEADGFVTYFGDGYERDEHLGVGPTQQKLPAGARVVVLGSADKAVMDEGRYDWIREHWR